MAQQRGISGSCGASAIAFCKPASRRRSVFSRTQSARAASAREDFRALPAAARSSSASASSFLPRSASTAARSIRALASSGSALQISAKFRRRFVELLSAPPELARAQMRLPQRGAGRLQRQRLPKFRLPHRPDARRSAARAPAMKRMSKSLSSNFLRGLVLLDRRSQFSGSLRAPSPEEISVRASSGESSAAFCSGATAADGSLVSSVNPRFR